MYDMSRPRRTRVVIWLYVICNRVNPGIMKVGFSSDDIVLTGLHPTRPLFEKMLEWSGFSNIQSLTEEDYDFPRKMQGTTNSS